MSASFCADEYADDFALRLACQQGRMDHIFDCLARPDVLGPLTEEESTRHSTQRDVPTIQQLAISHQHQETS